MRILGLHFGHDAGIALIEDGRVKFLAHCERLTRQKKATGIPYDVLKDALRRADVTAADIDFCAISSTQGMDIVLDKRQPFRIEIARHSSDTLPSRLEHSSRSAPPEATIRHILDPVSTLGEETWVERRLRRINKLNIPDEFVELVPCLNRSFLDGEVSIAKMRPLAQLSADSLASLSAYETFKFDFNYPVALHLDGRTIPAALISHHAAHAAATFYQSPFPSAAVLTLDGASNFFEGGLFWYGRDNEILPLRLHYLELGRIYLHVAHELFKSGSAEGKMMGLAPYGTPVFFEERFVANGSAPDVGKDVAAEWLKHLKTSIKKNPLYNIADVANPQRMTTPVNADVAASTQKLFEETMLAAVEQLSKIVTKIGAPTDNLSLSGGCMLNCPTNTRISQETSFRNVHVEPACDDGGLPAGAALWVYHNLMGHPRTPTPPLKQGVPYLGLPLRREDIETALATYADKIVVSRPDSTAAEGARRLAAGQVLGWFEGRSEIGPRALGHRSIVADPRSAETWERVNTIKGRELWRPLAPSVLAEKSTEWFGGMPESSPFMMFTGVVKRADVPAIAHIDSTARVQTVTADCGGYYDLITRFHALTGCAVVLNTSMNGPGQPIAEYPADAIGMLLDGRFDVLFVEDVLIERRPAA